MEREMKTRKVGTVAPNRIPIIAKDGTTRGNVGPRATTATVSRFLGHHNARLGNHAGRKAWIEQGTNSRPRDVRRPSADYRHSRGSVKAPGM
jgi:hypothetical protein